MSLMARMCTPASASCSATGGSSRACRSARRDRRGRPCSRSRPRRPRRGERRLDRHPHRLDVVQRVEDPEDVDPRRRPPPRRRPARRRPDSARSRAGSPAQQHLQALVRHQLAQRGEPLPRVLVRKRSATSNVAPPQHSTENISGSRAPVWRHEHEVVRAQARGEQRLVRVAERGVRHLQRVPLAQPPREPGGPSSSRRCFGPSGGSPAGSGGSFAAGRGRRAAPCRWAVDRHLRHAPQQSRRAVAAARRARAAAAPRRTSCRSARRGSPGRRAPRRGTPWLVCTPRTRTSSTARRARVIAMERSRPRAVTLSSSGSKSARSPRRRRPSPRRGGPRRRPARGRWRCAGVGAEAGAGILRGDAALQRRAARYGSRSCLQTRGRPASRPRR